MWVRACTVITECMCECFFASQSLSHIDINVTLDGWLPDPFDSFTVLWDTKSPFPVIRGAAIAAQTNTKTHTYTHARRHIRMHGGITLYDLPVSPHQKVGQLWLQHQPEMKELSGLSLSAKHTSPAPDILSVSLSQPACYVFQLCMMLLAFISNIFFFKHKINHTLPYIYLLHIFFHCRPWEHGWQSRYRIWLWCFCFLACGGRS